MGLATGWALALSLGLRLSSIRAVGLPLPPMWGRGFSVRVTVPVGLLLLPPPLRAEVEAGPGPGLQGVWPRLVVGLMRELAVLVLVLVLVPTVRRPVLPAGALPLAVVVLLRPEPA
jgi:hypothetical protein